MSQQPIVTQPKPRCTGLLPGTVGTLLVLIGLLTLLTGCDTVGTDANPYVNFRSQLRLSAELSERNLEPEQAFTATLQIRNVTGREIVLVTSPPRIADVIVRQNGELIWITGTMSGGPGIFGYHAVLPGQTYTETFAFEAVERRYDSETHTFFYVPLEPGEYDLYFIPNVGMVDDEQVRLPEIRKTFRVR